MRRIATAIDIDAPADAIWRVLVDFPAYPEWNPFIRRITGEAKVGAKLEVTAQPVNRKPMTFRPTVRVATPDRELLWLGRVLLPCIFDGEHGFRVVPEEASRCRLEQFESFRGLLAGPILWKVEASTRAGFEVMNRMLKRRAEAA